MCQKYFQRYFKFYAASAIFVPQTIPASAAFAELCSSNISKSPVL